MAALAATSSATPSLQSSLIRSRLETARREADKAQANVQNLREQVDAAESESNKRQNSVRVLTTQANQASQTDPTYKSRLQNKQPVVPVKTQEWLFSLYNETNAKRQTPGSDLKTNLDATPVLNAQGQATGRIVNLNA